MYRMSWCYVTLQCTLFICDPCNVSYVMSGLGVKYKSPLSGGGLDILWNDTINIDDPHILPVSMLESQRQNLF